MKYSLTTPCAQCPFRNDIKPFITAGRVREIVESDTEFPCHKTVRWLDDCDDEGEQISVPGDHEQHCAGLLVLLEKDGQPHQMMRIAERLGLYDARKLDMDAPVYGSILDAITAHRKVRT